MDTMEMIQTTKRIMNQLVDLEYQAACSAGLDSERSTLLAEFQALGIYVSGTDNNISEEEIYLFNYLFDMDLSPRDLGGLIQTLSGMYDNLINKLQLPGWVICKGLESSGNDAATELYIQTADLVMGLFAAVDGNSDSKEEAFIQGFLSRLKRDR